jgi:hypothetical protein
VTTAFSTVSPRKASASRLIFCSRNADSCSGEKSWPRRRTLTRWPIFRLNAVAVPSGLTAACRRAGSPTSICPSAVIAT